MKTPKPKRKRKPHLSDEDLALWRTVTETVEPLAGREPPPLSDDDARADAPPKRITVRSRAMAALAPPKSLPELSHDGQPGLDKATAKRLRRGKVKIEGRIDLHGMTQDEARPALENFIEKAWHAGRREVLVITGKGTRADGRIGVLRRSVPGWLNAPPNRARITAFSYAAPKDGGEGALYVRLKKRS